MHIEHVSWSIRIFNEKFSNQKRHKSMSSSNLIYLAWSHDSCYRFVSFISILHSLTNTRYIRHIAVNRCRIVSLLCQINPMCVRWSVMTIIECVLAKGKHMFMNMITNIWFTIPFCSIKYTIRYVLTVADLNDMPVIQPCFLTYQ
jgi:hypothetical protein